jgi:hypothetical protein
MSENGAKRCCMRSLSYWSHKTLESNMSLHLLKVALLMLCRAAPRPPCLLSVPGTAIFARFQHGSQECHSERETSVLEFSW